MSKETNNSQISRKVGVNRGVAALTALSLIATGAGCVATEQGGQVQAKIIDGPTKTSPLSPDFTKTLTPSPTDVNYELTPTVTNPATQELTLVSPTEVATQMPTVETGLDIKNIPSELNFIDGRNVKEMASSVGIDANTNLEVALSKEGSIVAYNLKTENKDLWVVNPLIEKGFKWNFDTNENGQYILHNALEEWKYKPYPIEGIKYVKPDQLPATFWDESNPVKTDEAHPWPSEGSLAVFDGEGDVLMYYSKQENAWWYAGYQSELPGNMTFRQSSSSLALTGIRYKPVDESVWKGPDLNERWQEIRNRIDWFAYTRRTGNYISFENFSSRVSNGEVFEYRSWLFDLATNDFKLVTLDNKTKMYLESTIIGPSDYGYTDLFGGHGVSAPGAKNFAITQYNPDNSISLVNGIQITSLMQGSNKFVDLITNGLFPPGVGTATLLGRSDYDQKNDKFTMEYYYNSIGNELTTIWQLSLVDRHLLNPKNESGEYFLDQGTPIVYPQVQISH